MQRQDGSSKAGQAGRDLDDTQMKWLLQPECDLGSNLIKVYLIQLQRIKPSFFVNQTSLGLSENALKGGN